MKKKYAVISCSPDGCVSCIFLNRPYLELADIKSWCDADLTDMVHANVRFRDDLLLCIDDNGRFFKKKPNFLASMLYGDLIVGNALLGTSRAPTPIDEPDIYAFEADDAESLCEVLLNYVKLNKPSFDDYLIQYGVEL